MFKEKSICLVLMLFVTALILTSCGDRRASEEEKHRDPRQQVEIPDEAKLPSPSQLQKPATEEYESGVISKKKDPSRLRWVSFNQALKMTHGEKTKLKAILYFASKAPCKECEILEEEIFTDPQVLKLSKRWVFVRINIDVNKVIAEEYKITSVPAFKALDHFGHDYKTHVCETDGPIDLEKFRWMLQYWH